MAIVEFRRRVAGRLPHDIAPEDRIVREIDDAEDDDGGRSVVAFLLGGVVIAGGMLAVLYLDSATSTDRDVLTTGSIKPIERVAPAQSP